MENNRFSLTLHSRELLPDVIAEKLCSMSEILKLQIEFHDEPFGVGK
jgi:hypothetical protein